MTMQGARRTPARLASALVLLLAAPARAQDGGAGAPLGDAGVSDAGPGTTPDAAVDGATPDAAPEEPPLPPAHRPQLTTRLLPGATIRTGQVVTLRIDAELPEHDDVTIPAQSFAPLELHARRMHDTVRNGRRTRTFELELLALEPGSVAVPAITLQVLTPDGTVGSVRTESMPLEVTSVLGNEPNAQPKAATAPFSLREEDRRPLYALAALAAMAIGGLISVLAYLWWSRRPKPVPPPPPPRPAWELAFERLEALRRDGGSMIAEGRVGPWIDALSDTVRDYLGKRYGFDGLECTSDELIQRIEAMRIRSLSAGELSVFLGECDLVKFAQASMTVEQAESMYRQAYRIVHATMAHGAGFTAVGGTGTGGIA